MFLPRGIIWFHCSFCGGHVRRNHVIGTPKGNIICRKCLEAHNKGEKLQHHCAYCKIGIENKPFFYGRYVKLTLCRDCYINKIRGLL